MDARGRFDAVHVRHRDVHEDDVGPQRMRLRDRLDAVGRIADDRELRPRVENVAERRAHRRVVVDDENPERVRGRAAAVPGRGRPDRREARHVATRRRSAAPRGASRRTRVLPGALSTSTRAAEQRQPLADAGTAPAHLAGLRSVGEFRRFEPNPLIGDGDAQLIVGVERLRSSVASIRGGVLDGIEEGASDRLEQQR